MPPGVGTGPVRMSALPFRCIAPLRKQRKPCVNRNDASPISRLIRRNAGMAMRALLLLLSLVSTGVASSAMAAASGPTQQVQATVNGILAILRDKQLDWYSKQTSIEAIIDRQFDFQTISQSVLATNWQKATPEERKRFVEFFSQYLQHTYTEKMMQYSNEYVRYGAEKVSGRRATVETYIVTGKTDIPVTYKLRLNEGKWFAYDVVIEGVSLVRNYRDTYAVIVKSEGIGGLLQNLESSIEKYKRQRDSGSPR